MKLKYKVNIYQSTILGAPFMRLAHENLFKACIRNCCQPSGTACLIKSMTNYICICICQTRAHQLSGLCWPKGVGQSPTHHRHTHLNLSAKPNGVNVWNHCAISINRHTHSNHRIHIVVRGLWPLVLLHADSHAERRFGARPKLDQVYQPRRVRRRRRRRCCHARLHRNRKSRTRNTVQRMSARAPCRYE